ncbi:hypothetical protein STEG23_010739, partial [Scotinomys teguina]
MRAAAKAQKRPTGALAVAWNIALGTSSYGGDSGLPAALVNATLSSSHGYHGGSVSGKHCEELPNGDPKEGPFWEDKGSLEVVLPPEKSEGHEGQGQLFSMDDGEKAAGHEGPLRASKKHLNIDALQCDVSVEEDNRQEWTFTLYDFDNSGKVTRE